MVIHSINDLCGCIDCKNADKYGRNCKNGLMFPLVLVLHGCTKCPDFKRKTTEQIKEQLQKESEVSE